MCHAKPCFICAQVSMPPVVCTATLTVVLTAALRTALLTVVLLTVDLTIALIIALAGAGPPPAKRSRVDASSDAATNTNHQPMATDSTSTDAGNLPLALSIPGPPEPTAQELAEQYKEQLGGCQLDTFDSKESRAYHSAFHSMAAESEGGWRQVVQGAAYK